MTGQRWFISDIAEWRGVEEVTIRVERSRRGLPAPDGYEMAEKAGHIRRPWWWESTIVAYYEGST